MQEQDSHRARVESTTYPPLPNETRAVQSAVPCSASLIDSTSTNLTVNSVPVSSLCSASLAGSKLTSEAVASKNVTVVPIDTSTESLVADLHPDSKENSFSHDVAMLLLWIRRWGVDTRKLKKPRIGTVRGDLRRTFPTRGRDLGSPRNSSCKSEVYVHLLHVSSRSFFGFSCQQLTSRILPTRGRRASLKS